MIKNPVLARLRAAHQFWVLVLLSAAAVMLVALTAITGPVWKMPGTLESWAAITIAIVFQALPFLVLGILVSAVISAIVPEDLLRRFTPRNEVAAVPVVCSTGLLLPGCECASVPVSNALMRRGIPPAAALAFLLASPAINPVVLISTAVAYTGRPEMAWARLVASLVAAVLVGWLWIAFGSDTSIKRSEVHGEVTVSKLEAFRTAAFHDLLNTGGFLVFGAMAAAAVKVLVPRYWFQALEQVPFATILAVVVLAVLLSLCSEADAFIAASLTHTSLTAQLVFLVVGPMVDLKLIAMQTGTWGGRFARRFVPLTLLVAIAAGCFIGFLFFGSL